MQIEYVKGDFIDGPEKIILHGCNAQGVMGRGAALAIKQRCPWAFAEYRRWYESEYGLRLGEIVWAYDEHDNAVGNMITQDQWHPSFGANVDYKAIRSCFKAVNEYVLRMHYGTVVTPPRIGMVKIGSGLAGGDWNIIEKIIEEESIDFVPVVYYL